jgi:hypothetical protein
MSVTLSPPASAAPFKQIKLHSGTTYRLNKDGGITVDNEDDAVDLEREGWRRDARSEKAARHHDQLLRKAAEAQARHIGGAAPHPRRVIGEVSAGRHDRVHIEHDQSADVAVVHGVTFGLGDIDSDLSSAFRAASAAYINAEQNTAEQTNAQSLVGLVVAAVLDRHDWVGSQVRERLFSQRYRA